MTGTQSNDNVISIYQIDESEIDLAHPQKSWDTSVLIKSTQLEDFFSRYGWNISLASPNVWNTGFSGYQGYFPIKASLTDTYLSFEVCPLIDSNLYLTTSLTSLDERLFKSALALNYDLQFVKLGLNIKGELTLSCQMINMGIDYEKFTRIVEILGYYCDELREYFLELIHEGRISYHHQA